MSAFITGGVAVSEAPLPTDRATSNAEGSTIVRKYRVIDVGRNDTIDEDDCLTAIAAATPLLQGSLIRRNVELSRLSEYAWVVTVTWETFRPRDQDAAGYEEVIRGSTGGATTQISHAINHVNSYTTGGAVTDAEKTHKGALNIERTKTGVKTNPIDVVSRKLEWSVERAFAPGTVTSSYVNTLYGLTGTVNDATFRTFAAGEVLFLGADFNLSNLERETVSYNFSCSPNVTAFSVGQYQGTGGVSVNKLGHEYMWFEHQTEQQTATDTTKILAAKLKAVHIEQVYYYADFSLLGI